MIFSTEDQSLMNILLDVIWAYNLDETNEVFMTFFPKIMDKVSAAIKI
jgi:acyl carrier protein phosphodiesterase